MFGFLTNRANEKADPLTGAEAAEEFCRALPRDDLLAAQEAICAALAEPNFRDAPDADRLRALLALETRVRELIDALLDGYIRRSPQVPSIGPKAAQAAFELCRALARTHGQLLRAVGENSKVQDGNEYVPILALHYFGHRQVELLLRPLVDEKSTRFPWKEIHDAFKFAQARDFEHLTLPVNRRSSPNALDTTVQREYIHVLLQDLVNGGHFSPDAALWVNQALPRWACATELKLRADPTIRNGIAVDADGDKGIDVASAASVGARLVLDTAPLIEAMRAELASLREGSLRPVEASSPGSGQKRSVLAKLHVLCATERPVIARRGERTPTALTVEVVVGLSQLVGSLSREARQAAGTGAVPDGAVTSSGFGSMSQATGAHFDGLYEKERPDGAHAAQPSMTMVDRSDSGCRLHGPALRSNPIVPGTLIAFREAVASPFMLGVVRWVKKRLAGKRVELGVEYLGRDPRRVVVVRSAGSAPSRFAALYLSGSVKSPSLPMKTLVLPVRGLAPDDRLSVHSRNDRYAIQLKEPLEEQGEFVWSPFVILEHRRSGEAS